MVTGVYVQKHVWYRISDSLQHIALNDGPLMQYSAVETLMDGDGMISKQENH